MTFSYRILRAALLSSFTLLLLGSTAYAATMDLAWAASTLNHADTRDDQNILLNPLPVFQAVTDTISPNVSLTSPVDNTVYTVNTHITLLATATDNVGVDRVEFRRNGVLMFSEDTAPYTNFWTVTNSENGTYTIEATAFDEAGNSSTSSRRIVVAIPADPEAPVVDITSPADGTTFTTPQTVTITADTSDNVGVVVAVLFVDGEFVENDFIPPYSYDLEIDGSDNGVYLIEVRSSDADGNFSTSSINVTVDIGVTIDTDADGIPNDNDNCPNDANPAQGDFDTDSIGDTCDPDDDNDGILDIDDNCRTAFNPDQADTDGNGSGDACEDLLAVFPAVLDFDDDGNSDFVYGSDTNGSLVYSISLFSEAVAPYDVDLGESGSPAHADYDGDGITDLAVTTRTAGGLQWSVFSSQSGTISRENFGNRRNAPLSGCHFDTDGRADKAVYTRRVLRIQLSSNGSESRVRLPVAARGLSLSCANIQGDERDEILVVGRLRASQAANFNRGRPEARWRRYIIAAYNLDGDPVVQRLSRRDVGTVFGVDIDGNGIAELGYYNPGRKGLTFLSAGFVGLPEEIQSRIERIRFRTANEITSLTPIDRVTETGKRSGVHIHGTNGDVTELNFATFQETSVSQIPIGDLMADTNF